MVSAADVKFYKSASSGLGGAISATQMQSGTKNTIFNNVSFADARDGEDFYRCFYIKNAGSETMEEFNFWLDSGSAGSDTTYRWGFDPSATAQTIPNDETEPTGIDWAFPSDEPETPNVGQFIVNATKAVWVWLHVDAGTTARLNDPSTFAFTFKIPSGGTGTPGSGGGGSGGNPPPTPTNYKIAFVGDEGCEDETDDVISMIQDQDYDYVVSVGDHAYASSSCWINRFNPLKSIMQSAYGNHEYDESGGIGPYKTFFGHNKTYYTFRFQNILFLILDTNIDLDDGSAQKTFIENALEQASTDSSIYWKIAVMHHPWFGSSSQHSYNEFDQVQEYHQLFVDNQVSFVITGHNHNFQRSNQVRYNSSNPTSPINVDTSSPFSRTAAGLIHVVSGTGGHDSEGNLYALSTNTSFQGYQNRTHNGVWEIVASNSGKTLTCSFVSIEGDKFDTFTIS